MEELIGSETSEPPCVNAQGRIRVTSEGHAFSAAGFAVNRWVEHCAEGRIYRSTEDTPSRSPQFLGDVIPIYGDGRFTHDAGTDMTSGG